MANIRELCAQLGFNSITHLGIYPKNDGEFIYDASPLLEASQNFVKEHVAKHGYPDLSKAAVHRNLFVDFVPIAHDFLKHNRFAQQYWPVGSVERPFRGPKWKKDTDLIEELVAKIIAHKMRNIKEQKARTAETRPEPESDLQPKDSSDPLPKDTQGPISSHIIDLDDFNSDVANDNHAKQPEGENFTIKNEVLDNGHFAGILSSIESNDTKKPSRERRDKTKFIGKRSLRKRTHKEMAVGIPPTPERSSKVCKTTDESLPSKRLRGRRIKHPLRLMSPQSNTDPRGGSPTSIESVESLELSASDKVVQGPRSSSEREMAQPKELVVEILDISFHFFGSNPSLGAIPKPYTAVNSSNAFFGAAKEAWMLTGKTRSRTTAFTAVSVTWDGAKRPVMIPWYDSDGFQGMISAVKKAERKGEVEVEVQCVMQG